MTENSVVGNIADDNIETEGSVVGSIAFGDFVVGNIVVEHILRGDSVFAADNTAVERVDAENSIVDGFAADQTSLGIVVVGGDFAVVAWNCSVG